MALYVGTVGLKIYVTLGIDLTGPGTVALRVLKPDNVIVEWAAVKTNPATGGVILYATVAGDLSVKGRYRVNSVWRPTGAETLYGSTAVFEVKDLGT